MTSRVNNVDKKCSRIVGDELKCKDTKRYGQMTRFEGVLVERLYYIDGVKDTDH